MSFGSRLKLLLEQRGMNQIAFARQFHLAKSTVSQYLSGDRTPDVKSLQKMAAFFGVSIDYLVGRTDDLAPKSEETPIPEDDVRAILRGARALTEHERKEILAYIQFKREQRMREGSKPGGAREDLDPEG